MTLEELAAWEERLMAALPTGGFIAQRIPRIEAAGLAEQWQRVAEGYEELLDDPIQGVEALRRATFLVWYSWNAPYFVTGICAISKRVELRVLTRLDSHLAHGRADPELQSMLGGYGPGLPFDRHPELAALKGFLDRIEGPYSPSGPLGVLRGRGAMGAYWRSRSDVKTASVPSAWSTLAFVPAIRAGGEGRTERCFWDAMVNGTALSKLLASDRVTPFAIRSTSRDAERPWIRVEEQVAAVDRLLGRLPPDLPEGRTTLYVCPECGDLGCGVECLVVEPDVGGVRWRDFGSQNDYEPEVHRLDPPIVGPFFFEVRAYRRALTRLRLELKHGDD